MIRRDRVTGWAELKTLPKPVADAIAAHCTTKCAKANAELRAEYSGRAGPDMLPCVQSGYACRTCETAFTTSGGCGLPYMGD